MSYVDLFEKNRKVREIVNEFQSDPSEIEGRSDPWLARSALYILLAMVISFAVWASVSKVDKVIGAPAMVSASAANILMQPIQTAIIKSIEVQSGDVVRKGQILATMDATFADADSGEIENNIRSLNARIARLETERDGRDFAVPAEGDGQGYYALQQSLYQERRAQYASQVRNYEERIAETRAGLAKTEQDIQILESRLEVARDVEGMRNELYKQEHGSRLNALIALNNRLEIEQALEQSRNALIAGRHQLESLSAERDAFRQNWEGEIVKELAEVRAKRDSLQEQATKAQRLSDLVTLRAPEDAVVLDMAEISVGSVVRAAESVMTLIPLDAPMEVTAYMPAAQIGRVRLGDHVTVKLDAFPYIEHGTLEGKVRLISGDTFQGSELDLPLPQQATFYRVKVDIDENKLVKVPEDFRLVPGMTGSAEINIGDRTIMSYLLRPMLKSFDEGMREP